MLVNFVLSTCIDTLTTAPAVAISIKTALRGVSRFVWVSTVTNNSNRHPDKRGYGLFLLGCVPIWAFTFLIWAGFRSNDFTFRSNTRKPRMPTSIAGQSFNRDFHNSRLYPRPYKYSTCIYPKVYMVQGIYPWVDMTYANNKPIQVYN